MNPQDLIEQSRHYIENNPYLKNINFSDNDKKDDEYNNFVWNIVTKRSSRKPQISEAERKKREHKRNMERKLREF